MLETTLKNSSLLVECEGFLKQDMEATNSKIKDWYHDIKIKNY